MLLPLRKIRPVTYKKISRPVTRISFFFDVSRERGAVVCEIGRVMDMETTWGGAGGIETDSVRDRPCTDC